MNLFIRELGSPSAPVVLLIHGQILDARVFDALGSRLAARWRVLVPDMPGHGRSPAIVPYSIAGVRERIEEALLERGIRRVAAVGFSLGAYHALALALGQRVVVERLALLGAFAGLDAPARADLARFAQGVRGGLDIGQVSAGVALSAAWAAAHPDLVAGFVQLANETSRETLVAELEVLAELPDLTPRLAEIRVPTLLRVGELDRNIPAELSREIAAAIPAARLEVVPGVGHVFHLQDAEGTAASLERFLGDTA